MGGEHCRTRNTACSFPCDDAPHDSPRDAYLSAARGIAREVRRGGPREHPRVDSRDDSRGDSRDVPRILPKTPSCTERDDVAIPTACRTTNSLDSERARKSDLDSTLTAHCAMFNVP